MTGKINTAPPVTNLPPVRDPSKTPPAEKLANQLLKLDQQGPANSAPMALSSWPETKVSAKPTSHDINVLLQKFTAGPQVEKIAVVMQDFMMQSRKIARGLMYAENTQYVARMEQAKQSVEQQAVWALSGAAMAGIAIVGAALNVVGALKSARHDKAGIKGIESKIVKFTKENLGEDGLDLANLGAVSPRASITSAASIRSTSSGRRSAAQADTDSIGSARDLVDATSLREAGRKQTPLQRVQELAELEDALTPVQQQTVSQLRGALTNESTRILSRYQATSGIVEASGRMLADTMHAMGTFEKATQIQFETAAGAAQFARSSAEQMLSSFTDGVNKMQQKVASIIESEADTRKHSIRA